MKLCSRPLILFVDIYAKKTQIWVCESHFRKVRADTRLGRWLLGKLMVAFLFTLLELFLLSITVLEL